MLNLILYFAYVFVNDMMIESLNVMFWS